jgi:hypothetical protein
MQCKIALITRSSGITREQISVTEVATTCVGYEGYVALILAICCKLFILGLLCDPIAKQKHHIDIELNLAGLDEVDLLSVVVLVIQNVLVLLF